MWLKVKFYKTGENCKLVPRRNGPWTVIRKLPNGVNFEKANNKTQERKILHHDRLTPCKYDLSCGIYIKTRVKLCPSLCRGIHIIQEQLFITTAVYPSGIT